MKNLILTTCLIGLAFLSQAQDVKPERKGFSIGASAGIGILNYTKGESKENSTSLTVPNIMAGWMLNQKLGLYLNMPGVLYSENDSDRGFEALIPSVKYWPTNRVWVLGGAGMAMDFPAFYQVDDPATEDWNTGMGALLGVGVELYQSKKWTIDLQSKFLFSKINLPSNQEMTGSALMITLGINYY
ncbi:hypothetical protein [Marivirga arenosa]|uniref:Outer membrane protein beta-barrel domain-containing protein n=1 Tax=Marivirga arenosa TaxID=3059076 RepID=A0AA49JA90_9BACT|nr:hypothetical protein [Marivirga sp. BKB1-2]WKK80722.1 hypothetical protein QYS47_27125 [Marivirga sp. BKB1-2]